MRCVPRPQLDWNLRHRYLRLRLPARLLRCASSLSTRWRASLTLFSTSGCPHQHLHLRRRLHRPRQRRRRRARHWTVALPARPFAPCSLARQEVPHRQRDRPLPYLRDGLPSPLGWLRVPRHHLVPRLVRRLPRTRWSQRTFPRRRRSFVADFSSPFFSASASLEPLESLASSPNAPSARASPDGRSRFVPFRLAFNDDLLTFSASAERSVRSRLSLACDGVVFRPFHY